MKDVKKKQIFVYSVGIYDNIENEGLDRFEVAAYNKAQAKKFGKRYEVEQYGKRPPNQFSIDVDTRNKITKEEWEIINHKISKIGVIK